MCEAEQWNLSKSYRAIKIYFHMQVNYNILPIYVPPIFSSTNSDKSRFFAHILKRISFQCGILTTKEKIFCAIL